MQVAAPPTWYCQWWRKWRVLIGSFRFHCLGSVIGMHKEPRIKGTVLRRPFPPLFPPTYERDSMGSVVNQKRTHKNKTETKTIVKTVNTIISHLTKIYSFTHYPHCEDAIRLGGEVRNGHRQSFEYLLANLRRSGKCLMEDSEPGNERRLGGHNSESVLRLC